MTPALEKLITDFFSTNPAAKLTFFPSAVDGTMCAEWMDGGRAHTATATDLGKRIMNHRRMMMRMAKKAAA